MSTPRDSYMLNTSPSLCSTKIPESSINPEDVSDIKERVVQAVRLSRSVQPSSGSSITSPSYCSSLNLHRPNSLWNFSNMDMLTFPQLNAAAIPISSQETIILNELLYCLIGIRGTYIVPENTNDGNIPVTFRISDQIHESLRDIVQEIIPLASHYSQIQKFIQQTNQPHCGQVLQALSAALSNLMNDYFVSIAQLESDQLKGNLSLHKLLFFIRPIMTSMAILADTVNIINNADIRGGKVLTLLHDKIATLTGDTASQKIIIHLTQKASVPYMEILQYWILRGVIIDPQQEFLVEDNEVIRREELPEHYSADYWEKRYKIRRERIPRFLEKMSDIILRTGKYLNVIRQCGNNVTQPQANSLVFSHSDQNYVIFINNAYRFASRTLLEVLMKENDLMGHLLSIKRYLLLQQGDFIMQFMDACENELAKNVDHVQPVKLENLLGLTLRLSSANNDPYKDDLSMELLPYGLVTQMSKIINNEVEYWQSNDRIDLSGLECFAFHYNVQWPVSLVLNHIAISKYQMLFRQLFFCKHVERQLCKVWKANNNAKKFAPHAAELYRSAFTLRQRMMNAVLNIGYYMLIEVIEPNWHNFIQNMEKVENVDDVLTVHQDFLDLCLKNCMLTDPSLLRSIIKLLKVCIKFCEFIQKAQRYFIDAELTSMMCNSDASDQSDSEYDFSIHTKSQESAMGPSDTFSENVKRFDLEFTGLLIGLLKRINDIAFENSADKFINLVHRINFNSFYNDQLELLCAKDSMGSTSRH